MAQQPKKPALARLNIYVPDPALRRQVKAAAARQDLSVSAYCLQAITAQLLKDGERPPDTANRKAREAAIAKARQFQAETFGGRIFAVSSAELIRETRERRRR
jgi:hypothetical protein